MRERFETTLKPELKTKLKTIAASRSKNVNELIEEWILRLKYHEED